MGADFSGYATKAGLKCTDGRTIMPDAFKGQDGQRVPLVWQHGHDNVDNVLGHAVLENRSDGVYTYAYFNDTPQGQSSKKLVQHGDVDSLSIWANKLIEKSQNVIHGVIREVSLVLSGANPGAKIDFVSIAHSDGSVEEMEDEAIISMRLPLEHEDLQHAEEEDGPTVQEIYDGMTEEQKNVVAYMVGVAAGGADDAEHSATTDDSEEKPEGDTEEGSEGDESDESSDDESDDESDNNEGDLNHQEGNSDMGRNVFENADGESGTGTLVHGRRTPLTREQLTTLVADGQKLGSFKESVLAHADDYGITNIEMLFPDAQMIDNKPEWITRRMEWVETVLNGTRKLPFSKIKSMSADLTHEEARAKGYIKETMKKEQFFAVAKRETGPKTIYKKQKLDRDDIIDITDFDVVAWIWVEMRFMLREEIARAVLVGDGREVDDEDKIDEDKIRPIATDDEFYTDVISVASNVDPDSLVEAVIRGRENYKGSGNPTLFTTQAILNDMVLQKDTTGRRLYRTSAELAAELNVSDIVLVPVMEDAMTDDGDLLMILVNLSDYSIGSTRGGEITTFDDFDIDYNQYKYLIEGRLSGALTKHKSAQVVVRAAGTSVTPATPTFVTSTGVLTVPSTTGVTYKNQDTNATLSSGAQTAIAAGATVRVVAVPNSGYYFPHNIDADWSFTRDA